MEYKVLDIITAIRTRPGMYIGNTETPDHLITEVLDNTLDELANGFANECHIFFEDNIWWITDNGKGLKSYDLTLPNGDVKDSIYALCTESHSGAKFDNETYDTLIGMHGVGLVVVNALSDWLMIRTRISKNKILEYYFNDSILESRHEVQNNEQWSTQVGFKTNFSHFNSDKFDLPKIITRLLLIKSKLNCRITFNGKEIPKRTFPEFVQKQLGIDEQLTNFNFQLGKNKKIDIFIRYSDNPETIVLGDVNLRICDGKYLNSFQYLLKNKISEELDRKFKDIPQNLLLLGLRLYLSVTIPEPQFSSQDKTKMTLSIDELINPLEKKIVNFLKTSDAIEIIEKHIENRLNKKITKTSSIKSRKISAENKLKDCIRTPGEILYILEGDSALGTLKQIRDTNTEAIFPLRGKILNVESASLEKIQNNKEIKYLLESLGPKEARRYKTIKIISDADIDGYHIVVLTIFLLMKFADDYLRQGKVFVILPPLYGAIKGKKYFPIYNKNEVDNYKNRGYSITRFKGLGEMSPDKLKVTLDQKVEYCVKWNDKFIKGVKLILNDTETKRLIMNNPNCNFEKILKEVISA